MLFPKGDYRNYNHNRSDLFFIFHIYLNFSFKNVSISFAVYFKDNIDSSVLTFTATDTYN